MTSVGGGVRFAFVCTARRAAAAVSFAIAFTILFAAGVHAQESSVDARRGAPVSKLELSKSIVDFAPSGQEFLARIRHREEVFHDQGQWIARTLGKRRTSRRQQCFTILSGQGTTLIQPHGESTVTVEFAPTDQGSFSASIAINSDATAGNPVGQSQTDGLGEEKERPTPTPTATATSTPKATATLTAERRRRQQLLPRLRPEPRH